MTWTCDECKIDMCEECNGRVYGSDIVPECTSCAQNFSLVSIYYPDNKNYVQ